MSKNWKVSDPFKFMGTDVWGKTAGIVGLGRIGTRIAERATGFKMKVQYYDIIRKTNLESKFGFQYKQFDELLKESDIIFIASPLSNDTRGIIGEREFSLMRHSALLINVARGPIIDHNAMIKALSEKRIAGAGLDVFYKEPLPVDDQLIGLENVVLTPHLASNTIECRRRMAMTVAEEVLRVLHGEHPQYAVNEISNKRIL
jgi:phosphoglycerate dehydrogenase-like enzyme